MTTMRVRGLEAGAHACHAVVVLESATHDRQLCFTIPIEVATRVAGALGLTARSSPVCDLVLSLTRRLGGTIARAVLDADDHHITSTLVVQRADDVMAVACHPGDAIALALRAGAPIDATTDALRHARAVPGPADDVAAWLDGVRPRDFGGEAAAE